MIWCQWLAKCSIDGSIDEWNQNEKIMLWGVCFVDGFIDGWWQCVLSNIGSFDLFLFFCNYMKWMSTWFLISIVFRVFIVTFFLVTTIYHEVEYIIFSQFLRLVQHSI